MNSKKKDLVMALNTKPVVVPPSQVEKVMKYLAGEIKIPRVSRPITYKPASK